MPLINSVRSHAKTQENVENNENSVACKGTKIVVQILNRLTSKTASFVFLIICGYFSVLVYLFSDFYCLFSYSLSALSTFPWFSSLIQKLSSSMIILMIKTPSIYYCSWDRAVICILLFWMYYIRNKFRKTSSFMKPFYVEPCN